ncbi:NAD(P)-binding domain-containing protein [Sphaerisporangium sp. TRM90804]|uniref:NADPH-dependent F420 reductase n=1 Tax=Sphaerisporangium sp. TRM90804 TaxID=3031113 RepID=UPI002449DAF0|nr:NAD(P)-binding domain-containing protein [Sphaerisporangium sp. TRM90804]MDH2429184.1 NAD(P)-binding domain-containing protein [Sphaerisporangium sp. TRM90804]
MPSPHAAPLYRDQVMDTAPPTFGVVGCGRMGSALARLLAAQGFGVLLTSRTRRSATELARQVPHADAGSLEWLAARADIVVLATPIEVTCAEIAPRVRDLVGGKAVIDVSNPGFAPRPHLPTDGPPAAWAEATTMPGSTSFAERIAALLPGAHVVKALNCVAAKRVAGVGEGGAKVTVPIAGDHLSTKARIGVILEVAGFDIADAGPLSSSRWIEYLPQLLLRRGMEAPAGLSLDGIGI